MINAYSSLMEYKYGDWEQYLKKIAMYDIFKDVIHEYKDKDTVTCVIRYILWAYSVESDMVVLNTDWHKNKQAIFEKAMVLPRKNLYEDLILLKNENVLNTINKWLTYQDNDTFTTVQTLKDLRNEMQISCLTDIKKASGEIDYSQKFLNAKYAVDLKQMIKDLESELIQNNQSLKEAVTEIKKAKRNTSTVGVEHYAN